MESQSIISELISCTNEYDIATVFATFSAVLNKFQISFDSESDPDMPLFFENENKRTVFLNKHHLWFVMISLNKKYSIAYLYKFLNLMSLKV